MTATLLPPRVVPDAELLARFVAGRDDTAFELLVWRYRNLVAGVCRRVLNHAHDAEDATQAAFLVFARRAASVRAATLPAWLAKVAYRCALRTANRRRRFVALPDVPARQSADDGIDAHLDAELDCLPDKYRVPLVLCYMHGLSYAEASEQLNCPTGTLCGWLTRGKELLRKRLLRRGVAVSAGTLAVTLGGLATASASFHEVRTVTTAALAFAAREPVADPSAAIASEVLAMMGWKRSAGLGLFGLLAAVAIAGFAFAQGPKPPDEPKPVAKQPEKTDAEKLQGVWLFDSYRMGGGSGLGQVWTSVVTITGDKFTITKVYDAEKPFAGTLTLDSNSQAIDFKLDEFDLAPVGMPLKVPATTAIAGRYKLNGDTLTVAVEFDLAGKRPADFTAANKKDAVVTLRRAPAGFKGFPKEVTVTVVGGDGKPAAGAILTGHMHKQQSVLEVTDREGKKTKIDLLKLTAEEAEKQTAKLPDSLKAYVKGIVTPPPGTFVDKATGWTYYDATKTAADGTAKVEYEKLRGSTLVVRAEARGQMGVAPLTPAGLVAGTATVKLLPECRLLVTGTCSDIDKAGATNDDHFNCYVMTAAGQRFAYSGSKDGKLEFLVPPGEYRLMMYGTEMMSKKFVPITVPANQSEYAAPPVDLAASGLHKLIGKPAPELAPVVAWKGEPVKLADLKGKVVLLEFWGYWCGPCIGSMPDLFKIHDEFKGKDVVIVGVHIDTDGEVTTAKQLDEKLTEFRKDVWKGRDIPFPVALASGKLKENDARGALADLYGIRGYPSTVLIDRDGKVVGKFHARDAETAINQLKHLLMDKK